ncbi:MAG: hypothetical protein C4538_10525 [Nitrospiraceae bacterium]|nr:MAG: hypothetical protein C4538_10525 [Nitrospiraceae bacterium]
MAAVKIEIGAEDKGTSAAILKVKSAFDSLRSHIFEIYASIKSASVTLRSAFEAIQIGAAALQAETSFKNVTKAYGEDAGELLKKMKQVSAGIIDESNLMQRAVRGLQQGLNADQIVKILEIARSSARVAGTDIASAFDGITNAVANQATRGLKLYGIVIDQKRAFEEYARAIGVSATALNEQEQAQALANAAIEEGQRQMKAMGEIQEDASEKIQKGQKIVHELKETIGKSLITAIQYAEPMIDVLAGSVLFLAGAFKMLGAGILYSALRFKEAGELSDEASILIDASKISIQEAIKKWKDLGSESEKTGDAMSGFAKKQNEATNELRRSQEALAKFKEELDEMADASEDWYNKITLLNPALKKTESASEKLRQEARKLKDEFGDMVWIEEGLEQGIKYIEVANKVEEYRGKIKEIIDTTKEQIQTLQQWRDIAVDGYNNAISKAKEYYALADKINKEFNQVITEAKGFQTQYKEKPVRLFEYDDERRNLKSLISSAVQSGDFEKIKSTMKQIEGFVDKYKGTKDFIGFDRDMLDITKGYDRLIKKLEVMRDSQVSALTAAGDAWMNTAALIDQSIADIDSQILELQSKMSSLQLVLNVDPAVQATQILKNEILSLPEVKKLEIDASGAFATIARLRAELASLGVVGEGVKFTNSMSGVHDYPGLATGTSYVPKTGPYILHQGEAVIPANQNMFNNRTSQVNNFNFYGSPQENAKEVEKILIRRSQYGRSRLAGALS